MKARFLRDKNGKVDSGWGIPESGEYIKDLEYGRIIIPYIKNLYNVVTITINGIHYKQIKVCVLQFLAWHGVIEKGHVIHHKDDNRLNDCENNLESLLRKVHSSHHNLGRIRHH
jgi:hypothetical protein